MRAKSLPKIRTWGSRGSNFSAPAKRHTSENIIVQLPAPGGPTALLSVCLLSCVLQCAGLRCAQAVAPRIKITPPFAPTNDLCNCHEPVLPLQEHRCACYLSLRKSRFIWTLLRAEVVMLFAVERLSERSEDWPTNYSYWIL